VTTTTYNLLDQVNAVTDPMGHTTSYVYDGFGDLIELVSPDSGTTVYTYNLAGDLTQRVDAAGVVTNSNYDALDRILTTTYPGDPAENVAYTYDQGANGIGRLTSVTDAAGSLSLSYNLRGKVTRETRTHGAATLVTAYTYDLADRLATITYPSGLAASYTRDNMGLITALSATPPGGSAASVVSAVTHEPFGPVTSLVYGDGTAETRTYDLDYRLTNLAAGSLENLTYSYDANDNVTAIADAVTPTNNQTFGYNKVNRLNQASGGYGAIAYSYDLVGNRLTQATNIGATQSYSYAAASNRLTQIATPGSAPRQFAYTPTGNIAQDNRSGTVYTLGYNQNNKLANFAGAGTAASYVYDAFGQRLVKTVAPATTLYQYDRTGHLIEDSDVSAGSAHPQSDYLYLEGKPIGLYKPGTGLFFYHNDRLGTPQLVTDKNKGVFWRGAYQPFGPVTITASLTQNLRLPGQYADAETGWSHNGARTYAQGLGRYLETDPVGLKGGPNTYAYADGNPVKYIDLRGLCEFVSDIAEVLIDYFAESKLDIPAPLATFEELDAGYNAANSVNQLRQNALSQLMPGMPYLSDTSGPRPATISDVPSFAASDLRGTSLTIWLGRHVFGFGPDYGSQ